MLLRLRQRQLDGVRIRNVTCRLPPQCHFTEESASFVSQDTGSVVPEPPTLGSVPFKLLAVLLRQVLP